MFAYCSNNPVARKDETGHLGIGALCAIGALVGGIINYAGQVLENYYSGSTGAAAWCDVDVGEIAAASFSGAIAAIPGSAAWGDLVDAIGSNIIESGVNALVSGEKFDMQEVGTAILSDSVSSLVLPDIIPTKSVPRFIRDIKKEARDLGIKGTKKLQKYLNFEQVTTIIVNALNNDTSDRISTAMGWG